MADKVAVVLLFGGRSSEHSISCVTARGVLQAIDRDRYRVIPVGITPEGAYILDDEDIDAFVLEKDELPHVVDNGSRIHWPENVTSQELHVRYPDGSVRSLGRVDIVFPVLHGLYGEDGTVQGMLELCGLPYVGSGVLASAVAMDKHFTKTILQHNGIAVAPWCMVTAAEWAHTPEVAYKAVDMLGLPLFVKPARAGSSMGVSKITSRKELFDAMSTALAQDNKVLLECEIVGRELEMGVLGGRDGEPPRTSVAGEIVVQGGEFYDFAAKYLGSKNVELICPARVTGSELTEMAALAAQTFHAVDAQGLARVDFFLTDTGFVVNEINTMPGFTPISMFPSVWLASGITYPQLIDELIDLTLNHS